jgi:alkylated DNA repair dioxygenase AlkB
VSSQRELFPTQPSLPSGFAYAADFLTAAEEANLSAAIGALTLTEARYKEWSAKRRIPSYGGRYDFDRNELLAAPPVPAFLEPLRERVAAWCAVPARQFRQALIAEYRPGTRLGWHRDVPQFEVVAGVSLVGRARLRLRRYPHVIGGRDRSLVVDLEPRSAYSLRGAARWDWQHAISPTPELRYSITFRTLRGEREFRPVAPSR